VKALFRDTETSSGGCALRILLVYELVGDELLPVILPVNSVRNVAMLAATTPLVAMVDVDLLLSANLATQVLKDKARYVVRVRLLQARDRLCQLSSRLPCAWGVSKMPLDRCSLITLPIQHPLSINAAALPQGAAQL
jgi:hypothetical protein